VKNPSSTRTKKTSLSLLVLLLFWALVAVLSSTIGPAEISFGECISILCSRLPWVSAENVSEVHETIIFRVRLPRILMASLVGASLAVAGAVFQGLLRNPLAEPYILGVSSGAAVGATVAMVVGLGTVGFVFVPALAFIGALIAMVAAYQLAKIGRTVPVHTLILAGVVVNAFFSAVVMFIVSRAGPRLHGIMFWLMGNLEPVAGTAMLARFVVPLVLVGFVVIGLYCRDLNVLAFGEESAVQLGMNAAAVKRVLFVSASLITGVVVAMSGMIGFVGLVVPHSVRMIVGADHRSLIPTAAIAGASFLIVADTVARVASVPVGAVTALIGCPFFAYLLRTRKRVMNV
jgi:iron complex transport system permease protein